MTKTRRTEAAALLALLFTVSAAACAGSGRSPSPAARGAHPDVETTGADTCSSCHASATPEVAKAWRDGRHGLSLVECVVCHGSTGADFRLRTEVGACAGCHPVEVRSVALAEGRVLDCFACHPAHALRPAKGKNPHAAEKGGRP